MGEGEQDSLSTIGGVLGIGVVTEDIAICCALDVQYGGGHPTLLGIIAPVEYSDVPPKMRENVIFI